MSNLTSSTASPNQQCTSFASPAAAAAAKKKRNLPGNPDPDAEVIALSPRTLMATNRFVCEVCKKGFQRDQNLQLHRRGHNLPWKLKQRPTATNSKDGSAAAAAAVRKKVYVCPEGSCVHHSPSRALGDLTGIKKHFSRKHGEKKYKCDKCSKKYAVHSDWKAHSKTCGTREYTCDCGTIFSRRDSFITHRAFCDALAEENAKSNPLFSSSSTLLLPNVGTTPPQEQQQQQQHFNNNAWLPTSPTSNVYSSSAAHDESRSSAPLPLPLPLPHLGSSYRASPHLSATALLQKAAQMGATTSCRPGHSMAARSAGSPLLQEPVMPMPMPMTRRNGGGGGGGGGDGLTRDFLGLRALSHKDMILSMAAAGLPCMGSSSSSFQHCQDQHY